MAKKTHVKPTTEELRVKNKEDVKELEAIEQKKEAEVEKEVEEVEEISKKLDESEVEDDNTETVSDISNDDDSDSDDRGNEDGEIEDEEVEKEVKEVKTDKVKKTGEEPDYKEKFKASTREAQVISHKNKAFDEASNIPEPTEEEMESEHKDWGMMDDSDKKMAKDIAWNKKRFKAINSVSQKYKGISEWRDKVHAFIDDPQSLIDNSDLEGKTDAFTKYANKKDRRGVSFDILVNSFLYESATGKKKNKGKMFAIGTGGPVKKAKRSNKITIEEASKLKKHNYKKYKKALEAGRIETI